ncbi:MAG: peptide ABC transporter substrate-binding protein [Pseudomonadota bacterium]|nr:peptide ABC transporter substrate-binding protein [Pseudomonadota bacterium]
MINNRNMITLLGILLFSLMLTGCSSDDPVDTQKQGPLIERGLTVLRKGNGAEPQTLDPHRAEDVSSSNILRDLYEGLVLTGSDGGPIPGVAESWDISADGKTYIFNLRPTAHWSNGDPVVAADFVAGMRRSVDPATGSNYGLILAPILNAEAILAGDLAPRALAVDALDAHTLRIQLKAPTPYFLGLLTHSTTYPIHRSSLKAYGERFARPGHMVSNGAYSLAEAVVQSHITLRRNPYYWDNANTHIDEVRYYPIEDASAEFKRYRAGELDWGGVPTAQFPWAKEHLGSQLHVNPYLGTYYYGFNLTRPPFAGAEKLRRALSMAIDRTVLAEKITGAGEIPAYGWVPPGLPGYEQQQLDYAEWTQEERITEARRLYAEAGYSADNPLRVEIRYNTLEDHRKIAVAISQMWKQALGVQTTLFNEEWKVFLQNRKQKQVTEVFRAGWIGDYPDPYTFLELMHSQHGINDSGYDNLDYDALLAAISQLPDGEARNRLMAQAESRLLADHPVIPLFFYVSKTLIKPWVEGYVPNIMNHHYTKDLIIRRPVGL